MDVVDHIIRRYCRIGILVDTNLLLLFVIGRFDRDRIVTFKNTQRYAPEDYDTVAVLIGEFDRLVTTPNILTEVSNLLGQLGEPIRSEALGFLCSDVLSLVDERYIQTFEAAKVETFHRFGLADTTTLVLARKAIPVLTDDFPLYENLTANGIDAINFNHVRMLGWS